jgi:muramoyltetrapeptide carboxypeptidase LdcA involved in peptidoglycan recycling
MTYAPKLKKGDGVRIIAPARSLALSWIDDDLKNRAKTRLEELGFTVTFGKYVNERDAFDSSSIEHRVEDLHNAFADDSVQLILTVIGGYNSNQLLRHIDYDLIRRHPKVLCGYSDITALSTAIYAQTGLVTYSGPHFFNFGQRRNFEYTMDYFKQCLFEERTIDIRPSEVFVDDLWATKQDELKLLPNPRWTILQEGEADGTIIGGNLGTLHLLQGTEFMPQFDDDILLFIEDDAEDKPVTVDRTLQSLLHQPLASRLKAIVLGRFQGQSGMTHDLLRQIIASKKELQGIPILANLDFGHTTPMITFPIGGRAELTVKQEGLNLRLIEH